MGVPEILKFVSRNAPEALAKLTSSATQQQLTFDFVLIDATNIAQTLGFDAVVSFLSKPSLRVSKCVIFVLDSARTRVGTARAHRTHATAQDVEVLVRSAAERLSRIWSERQSASEKSESCRAPEGKQVRIENDTRRSNLPKVLVSGRDVCGEADYKMLHIHRILSATAAASGVTPLPSFLMVSEDSDVFCGLVCGCAPQRTTIATSLRDTTSEPCLLQVGSVVARLAKSAGAPCSAASPEEVAEQPNAAPKDTQRPGVAGLRRPGLGAIPVAQQPVSPQGTSGAETAALQGGEPEEVRRKKPDGPMVATGTKVKLDDSDDSSDEEASPPPPPRTTARPPPQGPVSPAETPGHAFAVLGEPWIRVAHAMRYACVDFVFLFGLLMGNGCLPPLTRGVTKVDVQRCWQHYCDKRNTFDHSSGETGTESGLLSVSSGSKKNDFKAYFKLNSLLLREILTKLNYSDHLSRPPVSEERERAVKYLQRACSVMCQYILACHVAGSPTLEVDGKRYRCFLDTRRDIPEGAAPTLAALLAVLGVQDTHTFSVPMRGEQVGETTGSGVGFPTHNTGNSGTVTNVDNTCMLLGTSLRQFIPLHTFVSTSGKAATIQNLAESQTRSSPALGLFERVDRFWDFMTAASLCGSADRDRLRVLAPVAIHSNSVVGGTRGDAYSFELRRMAPLISGDALAAGTAVSPQVTSARGVDSGRNVTHEAILRAAGISFSYATAPTPLHIDKAPSAVVPPRGEAAVSGRVSKPKSGTAEHAAQRSNAAALQESGEGSKKKSTRLGKKERMKRRRTELLEHNAEEQ